MYFRTNRGLKIGPIMPTITPQLNEKYAGRDGLYPIIIRVEHQGKRRKIPVGHRVNKKQWDGNRVRAKHPDHMLINNAIASTEAVISRYFADCQLKGKSIDLKLIGRKRAAYSFTDYLKHRAEQYTTADKIVMGQKVNRFAKEIGDEVYFEDIDLDFLRELEQRMIDAGNVNNTRHKKFKFLGEFYGHAVEEGKAPLPNPFKSYKIPTKPVKKEKLTAKEIEAIEGADLAPGPIDNARNLFLFAYYCHGLRFGECLLLRRSNISNGRVDVKASKGNKDLSIKIHSRLQRILDHYDGSDFVFPYVKEMPATPREMISAIGSWNAIVNKQLKVIGQLAKLRTALTFHISRHSFASHLMQHTNSIHVIKDALGQSDYRTTTMYLESLSNEIIDRETGKLYGH